DVGGLGRMHRAHRPAIDARAGHGDEEQSVEARIAAQPRLLADAARRQGGGLGGRHAVQASTAPARGLAGFGHRCRGGPRNGRRSGLRARRPLISDAGHIPPVGDVAPTYGPESRSAGNSGAMSPSFGAGVTPSSRASSGYTSTLSNAGISTPCRNAGPRATNSARIDGNAGS